MIIFQFCMTALFSVACLFTIKTEKDFTFKLAWFFLAMINAGLSISYGFQIPNWNKAKAVAEIINNAENTNYTTYEIYKYMYRDKGEGLKNRDRLHKMYEANKEKPEINTRKNIDNSVGRVFGP